MVELYFSREKIWWNQGNETKPTYSDFNSIQWVRATNFNVNWVDKFTINMVIPKYKELSLIRIKDTNDNFNKYYYLEDTLSISEENKECLFVLDIYCTYILQVVKDINLYNSQSLSTVGDRIVAPTIKGIPSHNYIRGLKSSKAKEIAPLYFNFQLNNGKWRFHKATPTQNNVFGLRSKGSIYYVWKGKDDFILFPVIGHSEGEKGSFNGIANHNAAGDYSNKNQLFNIYSWSTQASAGSSWFITRPDDNTQTIPLVNSDIVAQMFVKEKSDSFLGIFVGPHYSTLGYNEYSEVQKLTRDTRGSSYDNDGNIWNMLDSFKGSGGVYMSAGVGWNTDTPPSFPSTLDRPYYLWFKINNDGLFVFNKIDNTNNREFKWGVNYLGQTNANLIETYNRLFFTDKFILKSEGYSVLEINYQIALNVDSYKQWYQQNKSVIDTGYATAGLNYITSLLGIGGGFASAWSGTQPSTTKTTTYRSGRYFNQEPIYYDKPVKLKSGQWHTMKNVLRRSEQINYHSPENMVRITERSGSATNRKGLAGKFGAAALASTIQFATTLAEMNAKYQALRKTMLVKPTTNSSAGIDYLSVSGDNISFSETRYTGPQVITNMVENAVANNYYGWEVTPTKQLLSFARPKYVKIDQPDLRVVLDSVFYSKQAPEVEWYIIDLVQDMLEAGFRVATKAEVENGFK